ncbi:precorrin-6y C5,15-methyltransferase (decarboxylating) subunit CbiE [Zongyangia hominis]|uniref:Precorrin-6y C5,15-methyltransferase (Decarboxylating) subunit CbiE n=1 Tax=Zongyangia hominis TaxID=2763677 RepID=A0A926IAN5_9FIRM|nr:precorrin-6y C5,15-methyltransferase (decarboxylating) subunit CbiE [Zongyangia hominis]MBC8569295.1 precorrin-6y C5,15-methyltransferase (decarboxylating) subunit CbiE [Zongyangia hominis]
MKRRVILVGTGMGHPSQLTVEAKEALGGCRLLIGAPRLLEEWRGWEGEKCAASLSEDVLRAIEAHPECDPVGVLLSGDVGFYSGAKKLRKLLGDRFVVSSLAGVSAPIYFCAKLGIPWEDVRLCSAHGRDFHPVGELLTHRRVFCLTGGKTKVGDLCETLCRWHMGECRVWVGERLSYPDERITSGTAKEFAKRDFDPLAVLLMENTLPRPELSAPGLPDGFFHRGKTPMTKSEVRCVVLSRLRLKERDIIWDVGAGTGSVSVEAALTARRGFVYAVERNPEAAGLIRKNREKAGAWNLRVVEGEAPGALSSLPAPDKVFIGGSGGNLPEILALIKQRNPRARVVFTAITLETLSAGLEALERLDFGDVEVSQLSVARTERVGRTHMLKGQNPVFILSGEGRTEEEARHD